MKRIIVTILIVVSAWGVGYGAHRFWDASRQPEAPIAQVQAAAKPTTAPLPAAIPAAATAPEKPLPRTARVGEQARRGCCSRHGGVVGCDPKTGRYKCRDGTISPSCECGK